MKIICVLLAVLAICELTGCDEHKKEGRLSNMRRDEGIVKYTYGGCIRVVNIDGHDYLLYAQDRGGGICHSASCKCMKEKHNTTPSAP